MSDLAQSGVSARVQGQPGPRYAWVDRALQRHGGRQGNQAARVIPPKRLALYRSMLGLVKDLQAQGRSILLDTGCGSGQSTRLRAKGPHFVLGIDKSLVRISKEQMAPPFVPVWTGARELGPDDVERALKANALIARAELTEFVQLALEQEIRFEKIDMLYPNPWPKTQHFGRRLYGHPVWPKLLALGQSFELRTNWEVYAQEFAYALLRSCPQGWVSAPSVQIFEPGDEGALTAFEHKYQQSGHALYQVVARRGLEP